MRRSSVIFLMLFALFWQSVALGRAGSTVNALADTVHTALHWQQEGHHHHEDGTYQRDNSKESVQHVVSDHVSACSAPPVSTSHQVPPLGSASPGGQREAPVPDPDPEGLLRPPRSHA